MTAIFYVAIVAVTCLFADDTFATLVAGPPVLTDGQPFFALYLGALAAPLAIAGTWTSGVLPVARRWPAALRVLVAGLVAWVSVVPVGGIAVRGSFVVEEAAVAGLVVFVSLAAYALGRRLVRPPRWTRADLRVLAVAVALGCVTALPLHLALRSRGVGP